MFAIQTRNRILIQDWMDNLTSKEFDYFRRFVVFFKSQIRKKGSVYMKKNETVDSKGSFPRLLKFVSQNEFIYL